jgi:stage II sporulation protein GA (sporulation sigma-E factor processing peptidase)
MYIIIKFAINIYKNNVMKKQFYCKVNIYLGNEKTQLNALVDTGNSLYEPITRAPVIVAEFNSLKRLFSKNVLNTFEENKNISIELIDRISKEVPLRIIPFSAIGSEHGILIGFNAEKAEIITDDIITIHNAVIAVYNNKLSKNGIYNALLNPEMLKINSTLNNYRRG